MGILNLIVASTLLTSLALAAPLNQRGVISETIWTTTNATTTVYDCAPTPSGFEPSSSRLVRGTSSSPIPLISASAAVNTTSTPVLSSSTAVVVASSVESTVPAATSPPSTTDTAGQSDGVATTSTVSVSPVAKSTSGDGTCQGLANVCTGSVTHWDGGLGACGVNVNTDNEYAIALPVGFMGSASNDNPYCGKSVTLVNQNSGTKVQATVKDKCMGCLDRSIDCTNKLFTAITDGKGDGVMAGIQWYFN